MKKQEWVEAVAERAGVDVRSARAVLDAFFAIVAERLQSVGSVRLYTLGKLFRKTRAARVANNFITGERVQVLAHDVVSFTPSASTAALVDSRK